MSNTFVKLPTSYSNFLNESKKIFNKDILEKLSNNSITYDEVDDLHNKINTICISYECNSYDINKMIHRYKKKNSMIDILKKIANLRNKYIVANAFKLPLWNKNIKELKEHISKSIKKKRITNETIEQAFLNLLKKYKYDWDGMWSIIELKNGNIININVFDLEDIDYIINYLDKDI